MTLLARTFATASALAITVLASSPATAAGSSSATALGLGQPATVQATSPFYAGYADTGVGAGRTRADFRVPEVSCDDADTGIAVTLYAISEEGEFLAGTDLFLFCADSQYVLDGHITTSGGQIPIWQQLEPGDRVRMSITALDEGPSTHQVAFENLTRGWTSSLPTNSPIDRIEVANRRVSLDGVRVEPLPYGQFRFSNVRFDGTSVAKADATRTHLVDDEGDVLIKTSRPRADNFRLVSKAG